MSVIVNEVRKGFYLDSVALMRMSADIAASDGVDDAVMMIGTPSNKQIMADAGLLNEEGERAGANDLVIALRADSDGDANRAIAKAKKSLEGGTLKSAGNSVQPPTLASACEQLPEANLALVSTPGSYATREAKAALRQGLNVMIFSDNVSLADEVELKQQAERDGLLVMGPDCGTAIIGGRALAFANAVPQGNTAVIAASGTGLQEFSVLLSRMGGGIRHAIGVGGRDLSDDVGAISTLMAIDLLAADPLVEQIVLISKPPGQATASRVFDKLAASGRAAIACVFGYDASSLPAEVAYAGTLKGAAELAVNAALPGNDTPTAQSLAAKLAPARKSICGLYTGGTLCTEAQIVMQQAGLSVTSNAPTPAAVADAAHEIIDLGADEYTVGKPHPMIEPAVRTPSLQAAMTNNDVAVVLIDLVLGYGAHANPAQVVAEALTDASVERPVVIASVCGTAGDPQPLQEQIAILQDAGVIVCACNADAAQLATDIAQLKSA
jgi:succinyl-CoA synthetase alpha subunit